MHPRVDRRTFLTLLALAGSAAAAPRLSFQSGKKVVVLGGGLAGLAAAWNLRNKGYAVTVLEAQSFAGGRVRTTHEPFQNGGYAELGAIRIFKDHHWTMKYIRAMELEGKLVAYPDDGAHLWYLQGKRFTTPQGDWPLDGLTPTERKNPFAMLERYFEPGFHAVGNPSRPGFPDGTALALDPLRADEYFKKSGASDAWAEIVYATEGDLRGFNALALMALEAAPNDGPRAETYSLVGGNDQLPKAIAARLGADIKYNTAVLKIAHGADGVTVTVRDGAGQHEIRADHCICALPFPMLRSVAIAPAFSQEKMDAIEQYQMMALARVYYQTKTRFWRGDPLGPLGGLQMIGTDTGAGRIWNMSALQPDPTLGMVQSYMADWQALDFARVAPSERVAYSRRLMAKFLPQLDSQIVATCTKAWQEDPWQRGAIAFPQPNQYRWMWPAARRAEGRVHFAGEHTSIWMGYQNGALESAERCVAEIAG